MLTSPDAARTGATVTVSVQAGTPAEVLLRVKNAIAGNKHMVVETDAAVKFGDGRKGYLLSYAFDLDGIRVAERTYLLAGKSRVFVLDCASRQAHWDEHQPTCDAMLKSLKES